MLVIALGKLITTILEFSNFCLNLASGWQKGNKNLSNEDCGKKNIFDACLQFKKIDLKNTKFEQFGCDEMNLTINLNIPTNLGR